MRIKLIVFLLCLCAAAGVVSCDDTDNPILPGEGALVVGLKELPATPPDSLTLYFFSADGGMAARKPNDALNTGIHYTSVPTVAEGYDAKVNRQVGADFVLTNGEESFVTVTIQMIDPRTGEAISTVSGIQIPYRRGHLTTVTGRFLTAGKTTGGVEVDDDWENDITIDF